MRDRWRRRLHGEDATLSWRVALVGLALVVVFDFYASPAFPLRAGGVMWDAVFWYGILPAATLLALVTVVRGGGLLASAGAFAPAGGYHSLKSCSAFVLTTHQPNTWFRPLLRGDFAGCPVSLPQDPLLQEMLGSLTGALLWGVVLGTIVYVAGRALQREMAAAPADSEA